MAAPTGVGQAPAMTPAHIAAPARARAEPVGRRKDTVAASLDLAMGASEYAAYEQELDRLGALRACELLDRLRQARGFVGADAGDEIVHIHEDQAVVEARIARLEELLRTATVIADGPDHDAATLGCTVESEYERKSRRARYRLSGIASTSDGLSVPARSPVGRALMGRRAGHVVSVQVPAGGFDRLWILAIRQPLAEAS